MTSDSIETEDKPCPLTISDWIALLAAESQVVSGYKHLVVTAVLAFFSILIAAYAATHFGTFELFMKSICVAVFLAIFTVLIYFAKLTIDMFKQKDKNLEIIEEIIAGGLTDSNEIRRRYHEQKNIHRRETDHRHPHETGRGSSHRTP